MHPYHPDYADGKRKGRDKILLTLVVLNAMAEHLSVEFSKVKHEEDFEPERIADEILDICGQHVLPGATANPLPDNHPWADDFIEPEDRDRDHYCPGHGDDEDCEIDPLEPCDACREQGYEDEGPRHT
jgi:hypothetical protein